MDTLLRYKLGILLILICTSLYTLPLAGQKPRTPRVKRGTTQLRQSTTPHKQSTTTMTLPQLYDEVQSTRQKYQPQSAMKQAQALRLESERQQHFQYLLWATHVYYEQMLRIDQQTPQADSIFIDLDRIGRLPWINDGDRAFVKLMQIER